MLDDTIAAISTSLGEAGIGIVRISGARALDVAEKVFRPRSKKTLLHSKPRTMVLGDVVDPKTKERIDEAFLVYMKEPYSYTGEDVVEIHCHGGVYLMRLVLELVLGEGTRIAERGEFTKRAFLKGKMDLSQAEAVIDVICSRTEKSLLLAQSQLEGGLKKRVEHFRDELQNVLVRIEASIDFPEDDIPEVEIGEIEGILKSARCEIERLMETAEEGKILREGVKIVIAGKPNVGKSSLLNKLLKENRALVSDIPGTTRDVIEETVNLKGIAFRILDTAGIRETEDFVEKLGVDRAVHLVTEADLVIHVLDRSVPVTKEDYSIFEQTKEKKRVILVNKTDLPPLWEIKDILAEESAPIFQMSLTEDPLDPLVDALVDLVYRGSLQSLKEEGMITRSRHKDALRRTKSDLDQALDTIHKGFPVDLVAVGLYGALEQLGEITGETVRDTVIEEIFAQFCIGK